LVKEDHAAAAEPVKHVTGGENILRGPRARAAVPFGGGSL